MGNRLQWVNYPDSDKAIGGINVVRANFTDTDVTTVDEMSRNLFVAVKFKKKEKNTAATLTIKPDGGNAAYTATEKTRGGGIFAPGLTAVTNIGNKGVAKFPVVVTPAGGDVFEFEATSRKGTKVKYSKKVETRRKLYYQVVRMRKATELSGAMLGRFEQQFWKEDKKLYIKLEKMGAKKPTIRNKINFDDFDAAQVTALRDAARKAYSDARAPFSIIAVVVNKNCNPGDEVQSVPILVNGNRYILGLVDDLFYYADKNVPWFTSMQFTPAGGAPINIPKASVRIRGKRSLQIDTTGFPHGPGQLDYSVRIIQIVGMGLSLPTENLVTIASRDDDGKKVPAATMAAVLTHEVGHKIGMVPGPMGDSDLDKQTSYYDTANGHHGPHCHHGTPWVANFEVWLVPPPKCTMFGDTRTNTSRFCPHCQKSIRKLDVSPERKAGIATQF
jgi:hypothetical protein